MRFRIGIICGLMSLVEVATASNQCIHRRQEGQAVITDSKDTLNDIPYSTRAHWMRRANQALSDLISPCPFAAFGTVIVNHTSPATLGDLICIGANSNRLYGNPTLHGEIAAINNCTKILGNPEGRYKLSPSEISLAWKDLSLYTNAESCPMCASAIRWAGFKEYIYGTSIAQLTQNGWGQIQISSAEVFEKSSTLGSITSYLGSVLSNGTDPYFLWQFNPENPCPHGCQRDASMTCSPSVT